MATQTHVSLIPTRGNLNILLKNNKTLSRTSFHPSLQSSIRQSSLGLRKVGRGNHDFACFSLLESDASAPFSEPFVKEAEKVYGMLSGITSGQNLSVENISDTIESLRESVIPVFGSPFKSMEGMLSLLSTLTQNMLASSQSFGQFFDKSSSLEKIGSSSIHLAQSADAVYSLVANQISSVTQEIQADPFSFLYLSNAVVLQYYMKAINTAQTDIMYFLEQQENWPFIAIASGTSLGVILGNFIAWGLADEGQMLPSRYDPEAIAAFFYRRPLDVLVRFSRIFVEASKFTAMVNLDKIQGKLIENEEVRARQLVEIMTRLGPTAIKVGQALSIRPDLLSVAYLEQLQTLQDRVPPFSNEEAQRIIREGLGKDPSSLFAEFSVQPIAAASIGQVYRARLKETGQPVAVKVQRPGVLEEISCDLFVLRSCATLLQKLPQTQTDLEGVLDNWANRFFDELDYIQEGQNAIRFARDMQSLKNLVVPQVYTKYTSRRVLTTEWVEGEKLSESTAPDLGSLLTSALNCYLIQLLETGFLHADPHPGNLLRTPDGKLCVLDYGLMTEVTVSQQYALIDYISHLVNNDFEAVAGDLVLLGFVPEGAEDPAKIKAVVEPLSRVLGQLVKGGGAKYVNIAQVTDDLAKMGEQYTFVIPPYFALILRAFSVLEGIALKNNETYSIVEECYPYISKRLITDDSSRAREAFRYFLYGKSERISVDRVENIVNGFQTFRELMAPVGPPQEVQAEASGREGVDPTAREALKLVFSAEGSYLQEILLTELVRSVDALSRETQAALWRFVLSRAPIPIPEALTVPGSWPVPLPVPGMMSGIFVRGDWVTARVSKEDEEQLVTVRRLWALLEPQLSRNATPASPADFAELVRDAAPVLQEMWPGMLTTGQKFMAMLVQRQALRLADDLDGGNSVAEWDKNPAQVTRMLRGGSGLLPPQKQRYGERS